MNKAPLKAQHWLVFVAVAVLFFAWGAWLMRSGEVHPLANLQQWRDVLLQPLAENAIQYSVAEIAGNICLQISLQLQDGYLQITLAQQGANAHAGWPDPRQPANLINLAERLQLLFGAAAGLTLSHSASGFYSQLRIAMEVLHDSRT